jgi:hypothetical protein
MKEAELRRHATCDLCHQKIGHTGLPLFWRVTVERFGIDLGAVRRQDGLGQFMGSIALAGVFSPGEDMAKPMMDPKALTVCDTCATAKLGHLMGALE